MQDRAYIQHDGLMRAPVRCDLDLVRLAPGRRVRHQQPRERLAPRDHLDFHACLFKRAGDSAHSIVEIVPARPVHEQVHVAARTRPDPVHLNRVAASQRQAELPGRRQRQLREPVTFRLASIRSPAQKTTVSADSATQCR